MSRRSLCWDNYNSEIINLNSSDDDSDGSLSKRKSLISSTKVNKFRIDSESSSDDCVIYSSDEESALPSTLKIVKNLKLPTFSFETPDKKTLAKNAKLLRDISNICQSASKERKTKKFSQIDGSSRNSGVGDETTLVDNDRLFDSLVGIDINHLPDDKSSQKQVNGTYGDILSKFNNLNETKNVQGGRSKDVEPSTLFKRPSNFQKQKEIGNKVKRPGDSVIILRRTDDSDSSATEPIAAEPKLTNDNLSIARKSLESKLLPNDTSDSDDCVNERRQPPKRKGKTSLYSLSDLKSALDEIDDDYSNRQSPNFMKSLSDDIDPTVCHPKAKVFKDKFVKKKEELTALLYKLFNARIFKCKLPDDMSLDWSGRMTSSAGITHLSRKITDGEWVFLARITLSKPIVTTTGRLRDTLIHEMCHAAVWLLDRKKDGHGPLWKSWTYKARNEFPELLPINTCHSYSKQWKFFWACISCGYTIGRMTKSFDTQRFSCGRCHGKFELKTDDSKKRKANGFALFVKENYASVRTDGICHKDVMKTLSQKYQNVKPNKEIDDIPVGEVDLEITEIL